jgi:hypothetical protein
MTLLRSVVPFALIAACAVPLQAQRERDARKDTTKRAAIPADARPPKGMCRVWIDGVPAAQQPAATDCPTAVKNLPPNARILFGDDLADSTKGHEKGKLPPNIKGFAGQKPTTPPLPKRPPD